MILLLAVAVLSPWLVIASLLASKHAASGNPKSSPAAATPEAAASASPWTSIDQQPQEWVAGKKGPWGQIESMVFAIDVPDEFIFVPPADQPPVRWSFPGYSKEKVLATLRSVGLPEDDVKKLDGSAKWSSDDGAAALEPGDPLILGLTPEVRSKLYALLITFPQNGRQIDPIWFRPGGIDWRLEDSGLAPESIALLEAVAVRAGRKPALVRRFRAGLAELAQRRRAEAFHEGHLAKASRAGPLEARS